MKLCKVCKGKDICICVYCEHNGMAKNDDRICSCVTNENDDIRREGDVIDGIVSCTGYIEDWIKRLKWLHIKVSI